MKKFFVILGFILMATLLKAQSIPNFYYANGVPL